MTKSTTSTQPRSRRTVGTVRLIAAIIAVLLSLTACGGGFLPIKDRAGTGSSAGIGLKPNSVPEAFVGPLTQYGGTVCPEITAPILAAQIKAESNFIKGQVSPAGAMGFTQFMPGTWAAYGEGGDPNNEHDAVRAQAKYDCAMVAEAKKRACPEGEIVKVALAMYNAGPGGVSGCTIPTNGETEIYVPKIMKAAEEYAAIGAGVVVGGQGPFIYDAGKSPGENAVLAAMSQIGITYAWGGGSLTGPSQGIRDGGVADTFGDYNKIGWDCSGLSRYAIYQGSRGTKTIGRNTNAQENGDGTPVADQASLKPGDLIFWPGHVAIAAGGGKMVEAQQSGTLVKVSDIRPGGTFRRFLPDSAPAPAATPAATPAPAPAA